MKIVKTKRGDMTRRQEQKMIRIINYLIMGITFCIIIVVLTLLHDSWFLNIILEQTGRITACLYYGCKLILASVSVNLAGKLPDIQPMEAGTVTWSTIGTAIVKMRSTIVKMIIGGIKR